MVNEDDEQLQEAQEANKPSQTCGLRIALSDQHQSVSTPTTSLNRWAKNVLSRDKESADTCCATVEHGPTRSKHANGLRRKNLCRTTIAKMEWLIVDNSGYPQSTTPFSSDESLS
jgi:hypothetical protein